MITESCVHQTSYFGVVNSIGYHSMISEFIILSEYTNALAGELAEIIHSCYPFN